MPDVRIDGRDRALERRRRKDTGAIRMSVMGGMQTVQFRAPNIEKQTFVCLQAEIPSPEQPANLVAE